jgi:hypothetical protein
MGERHSDFNRDADDWYVEPEWCVHRLLDRYPDLNTIHDPCCGRGTIVDVALSRGIEATGSDLIDRADGRFPSRDFLCGPERHRSIVTNPPFKIAERIVAQALMMVAPGGIVAVVAQAKFLFSQGRNAIFARPDMERVIAFSRRPSMPPGKMLAELGESCRGGGSIDFVWCVWRVGKTEPGCVMEWTLRTIGMVARARASFIRSRRLVWSRPFRRLM